MTCADQDNKIAEEMRLKETERNEGGWPANEKTQRQTKWAKWSLMRKGRERIKRWNKDRWTCSREKKKFIEERKEKEQVMSNEDSG